MAVHLIDKLRPPGYPTTSDLRTYRVLKHKEFRNTTRVYAYVPTAVPRAQWVEVPVRTRCIGQEVERYPLAHAKRLSSLFVFALPHLPNFPTNQMPKVKLNTVTPVVSIANNNYNAYVTTPTLSKRTGFAGRQPVARPLLAVWQFKKTLDSPLSRARRNDLHHYLHLRDPHLAVSEAGGWTSLKRSPSSVCVHYKQTVEA